MSDDFGCADCAGLVGDPHQFVLVVTLFMRWQGFAWIVNQPYLDRQPSLGSENYFKGSQPYLLFITKVIEFIIVQHLTCGAVGKAHLDYKIPWVNYKSMCRNRVLKI